MNPTTVYKISKPDPSQESRYVLFIRQPGSFGGQGSLILLVNDVVASRTNVEAVFPNGDVARFSPEISYMLIPRALVEPTTVEAMVEEEHAQRTEWETAYKKHQPEGEDEPGATISPEALLRDPGQYL